MDVFKMVSVFVVVVVKLPELKFNKEDEPKVVAALRVTPLLLCIVIPTDPLNVEGNSGPVICATEPS